MRETANITTRKYARTGGDTVKISTPALRLLGLLALILTSAACTPLGKTDITRVVTSGRDGWQHPEQVVDTLGLKEGDRVAEVGAGDGYWLTWLAEAVGPTGRVYAVEVEEEKVEKLRQKKIDEALDNVIVVFGTYEDPMLPDGEIDLAMTCLTYHHIDSRPVYFRKLQVDLAPGGRVAHLDDRHDTPAPFSWLQGDGHFSDPAEVVREMETAGYEKEASFDFLPVQSFQIFAPVSPLSTKTAGQTAAKTAAASAAGSAD
jgi:arsenite methyltransferase